jgi:RNA polymerase sigma-70 factor (ECF subfamily)
MEGIQALHNDQSIIERMQQGDERALELLFKTYYAQLCRFARNMLKDSTQAEDMVQDVFMKVWDKRGQINITTSLKAYLFMAVRNHCLNALKVNERKFWMDESMEDDTRLSDDDMINELSAKSLSERINVAIDKLPAKCRQTFQLSRFEELSYKEIAETMNVSVKTVENQMGKALSFLRTTLDPYIKESMIGMFIIGLFAS